MAEGPVPIGEVGKRRCDTDADNFGAEWLVVEQTFAALEAQIVKEANVDDEANEADNAEFGELVLNLVDEFADLHLITL